MSNKTVLVNDENNCVVTLYEKIIGGEEASALFKSLQSSIPWKYETDCFGTQNRKTFYAGDEGAVFAFCGLKLRPNGWSSETLQTRDVIEKRLGLTAGILTGCLMNYYGPGKDFIPWHHDEVRAHGKQKIVASLSLGEGPPRLFRLRKRNQKEDGDQEKVLCEVALPPGSVLLMKGDTQEYYDHELPVSPHNTNAKRISLTFRSIVPGFEDAALEPPIYIP